jgi:hypothetical protein
MSSFERPFESLEQLHETELGYLQRMIEAEVEIAIPAAKHYCVTHGLDVPNWLARISIELECAHLRRDANGRGRTANSLGRHRHDMRHFARWDAVWEVRDKQDEFRIEIEKLRTLPNVPTDRLKEREKMLRRVGDTLDDAFRCASNLLAKTDAFGCPETIKKSYLRVEHEYRVERETGDSKEAKRYHLLDRQFLCKIYRGTGFGSLRIRKSPHCFT